MKQLKKFVALGSLVLAISATAVTAFAASKYNNPAEAVAGLTGKTVESVIEERQTGRKTYGEIANEAGKLVEFNAEMLEMRKDSLALQVANGRITQAQADEYIKTIEDNQAICDGTGLGTGAGCGAGVGGGLGGGGCGGAGTGTGTGGQGRGMGRNR